MAVQLLELKFRLYDGTDIGPNMYALTTTIANLKESILAQWPKDKEHNPRTINALTLINAGRILENNKTLAESRVPVGEIPGGVVTMHVVVRPPAPDNGLVSAGKDSKAGMCAWEAHSWFAPKGNLPRKTARRSKR